MFIIMRIFSEHLVCSEKEGMWDIIHGSVNASRLRYLYLVHFITACIRLAVTNPMNRSHCVFVIHTRGSILRIQTNSRIPELFMDHVYTQRFEMCTSFAQSEEVGVAQNPTRYRSTYRIARVWQTSASCIIDAVDRWLPNEGLWIDGFTRFFLLTVAKYMYFAQSECFFNILSLFWINSLEL